MKNSVLYLMCLLALALAPIWLLNLPESAQADYLGEFTEGDSIDVVFGPALDENGHLVAAESCWVYVYRDTTGGFTVLCDTIIKAVTELPVRTLRSELGHLTQYSVRFEANGGHTAGRYQVVIIYDDDGSDFTPMYHHYNVRVDSTSHEYIKNNRLMVQDVKDKTDSLNFQGMDRGAGLAVDVIRLSGDSVATDNFETMLDGTGGKELTLSKFAVYAADDDTAVVIRGAGDDFAAEPALLIEAASGTSADGPAVKFDGGTGGHGLHLSGTGVGGKGFYIQSASNTGLAVAGGGGAPGVSITGGSTGRGVFIEGGSTSGDAVYIYATDGDGLDIRGTSNYDINLASSGTIHGTIDSCDKAGIGNEGLTADALDTTAVNEMAEAVWNVDTSGAWNDDLTKFGEWNAQAQVGGAGSGVWSQAEQDSVMDALFGGGDDHDRDSNMLYMLMDDVDAVIVDVGNIDGWNPITDNESLIVDQSSMRWDLSGSGVWSQAEQDSVMDALFGGGDDHDRDSNMVYMLVEGQDDIPGDVWGADTGGIAQGKYGCQINDFADYKGSGTGATAQEVWEYNISDIWIAGYAATYMRQLHSKLPDSAFNATYRLTTDTTWTPTRAGYLDNISDIKDKTDSLNFQGVAAGVALASDVTRISGDATSADNFQTMLDGTGGKELTLSKLAVYAADNDTAIVIRGAGDVGAAEPAVLIQGGTGASANGPAIKLDGGTGGHGLHLAGTGVSGQGLHAESAQNIGAEILGGGSGSGAWIQGGTTGKGLVLQGGSTSGDAVYIYATDGDGLDIRGTDNYDINLASSGTIHGTIDSCDKAGIGNEGLDADAFDTTAVNEVAEAVWNVDTTGAWDDDLTKFGEWNAQAQTGAAGGGATAEQIWSYTGGYGRQLTMLDEDSTTLDLDGTTVSASCAGSGMYSVNIDVEDGVAAAVPDYQIAVYDSSTNTLINRQSTNTSGRTSWSLDAAVYKILGHGTLYESITATYSNITADKDTTFSVNAVSISADSADECRCYVNCRDLSTYDDCILTAKIPEQYGRVTTSGWIISPFEVSATADDTGFVYLDVPRSSEMTSSTGDTVKVLFELNTDRGEPIADTLMVVPDAASKHLWH